MASHAQSALLALVALTLCLLVAQPTSSFYAELNNFSLALLFHAEALSIIFSTRHSLLRALWHVLLSARPRTPVRLYSSNELWVPPTALHSAPYAKPVPITSFPRRLRHLSHRSLFTFNNVVWLGHDVSSFFHWDAKRRLDTDIFGPDA
eukprot:IDg20735t1